MMKTIKYVFRMVHIANIPHILQEGFVHNNSSRIAKNYVSIGDKTLIEARKKTLIYGRPISEYIPFYFGYRSPMLYVIQNGFNGVAKRRAEEIIYCVLRIDEIVKSGLRFVFTDGHANDFLTSVFKSDKIIELNEIVKTDDVYAKFWKSDDDQDLKRRKDAELLFLDEVPPSLIAGFVAYNQNAKQQLEAMGVATEKIVINSEYYY